MRRFMQSVTQCYTILSISFPAKNKRALRRTKIQTMFVCLFVLHITNLMQSYLAAELSSLNRDDCHLHSVTCQQQKIWTLKFLPSPRRWWTNKSQSKLDIHFYVKCNNNKKQLTSLYKEVSIAIVHIIMWCLQGCPVPINITITAYWGKKKDRIKCCDFMIELL